MNEMKGVAELCRCATASEDGESYMLLASSADHRTGLVARITEKGRPILFLEITLVNPCETIPQRMIVDVKRHQLEQLEGLLKRGYLLTHEDNCSYTCEREVSQKNLIAEMEKLSSILDEWSE